MMILRKVFASLSIMTVADIFSVVKSDKKIIFYHFVIRLVGSHY